MAERRPPGGTAPGLPISFHLYRDADVVDAASPCWGAPLPRGPEPAPGAGGPTFGAYFESIADWLRAGNGQALREALAAAGHPLGPGESMAAVAVRAEKHGPFYHPARVAVHTAPGRPPALLALNLAASEAGRALMEAEIAALERVGRRLVPGDVPRVLARGTGRAAGAPPLPMFLADWFEGFCEFHLARRPSDGRTQLRCWEAGSADPFLDARETRETYRQVARLLTRAFDPRSSTQIYPWHHATGDFVVRRGPGSPQVKLVSVRRYGATLDFPGLSDPARADEARFLGLLVFFLNLTVRMRLDRLEGTGETAWAGPEAVGPTVEGFAEGLPAELAAEWLPQVKGWSAGQLLALLGPVADFYGLMAQEAEVIAHGLPGHARDLAQALKAMA